MPDAVTTLRPFLTDRRAQRIEEVIARRLAGVTVLLENLYDHGNIVAILRTCEALGVHGVNLIELDGKFKAAKKVSQGAEKWLDLRIHEGVTAAVDDLHTRGFTVLAADLEATQSLDEIDVSRPVALVFGSEGTGISDELRAAADGRYIIPMIGYTQSLNVSCAAAIALHDVTKRYRAALAGPGDMTPEQQAGVRELFYRRAVRQSDMLLAQAD